ncbi:MAG TPA: CGNR zinc finger domain-containing protein [Candidatus Baltobacteraceae bacterium]|nr:CGNR zinc finger domain-containing protein [Candidatus Baltobacteraceae bacterium]
MVSEAPGRLDDVRGFLNTFDFETDADPLKGPDRLGDWLNDRFPALAGGAEEARLRGFREALRRVVEANAGEEDPLAAWGALAPYLGASRFTMTLAADGRPALEPEGEGASEVISGLLAVVYDATGSGEFARLKSCRRQSCRYAYYDRSKNGSGAWCDMAVCGNRVKAERRRARQKSSKNR